VAVYVAYYLPGLPVALAQTRFDQSFDAKFTSSLAFTVRGVVGWTATLLLVAAMRFNLLSQTAMLPLMGCLGLSTWCLHGSASQLAQLLPKGRGVIAQQLGFALPAVLALGAVAAFGITESVSEDSLDCFFGSIVLVALLGFGAWLVLLNRPVLLRALARKDGGGGGGGGGRRGQRGAVVSSGAKAEGDEVSSPSSSLRMDGRSSSVSGVSGARGGFFTPRRGGMEKNERLLPEADRGQPDYDSWGAGEDGDVIASSAEGSFSTFSSGKEKARPQQNVCFQEEKQPRHHYHQQQQQQQQQQQKTPPPSLGELSAAERSSVAQKIRPALVSIVATIFCSVFRYRYSIFIQEVADLLLLLLLFLLLLLLPPLLVSPCAVLVRDDTPWRLLHLDSWCWCFS
jgi:hypothetical protein